MHQFALFYGHGSACHGELPQVRVRQLKHSEIAENIQAAVAPVRKLAS